MTKKKIIFIVNPISGNHNKNNFPVLVDNYIDKNKFDYKIVFTERVNHATELTMKAIEDGFKYIAAVVELESEILGISVPLASVEEFERHQPFGFLKVTLPNLLQP